MADTIYRQDAIDALGEEPEVWEYDDEYGMGQRSEWCYIKKILEKLPSAQQDDRLNKIAELVDGTIYHFDRDDAMDLLYQIKEVLK